MENEQLPPSDDSNEKTFAILSHLTPLLGYCVPAVGFLAPLLWWALMKDKSAAVAEHGKEVLNFALSYMIYFFVAGLLIIVVIGIPLLIVLSLAMLVFMIIGTIKAANDELYRYPLIIRFLK